VRVDETDQKDGWSEPPPRTGCGLTVVVLLLLVIGGGVAVYFLTRNPPPALDDVRATEGRLTLADDDGKSLEAVDREERPELWYRVMLDGAPVGATLDLSCDWVGPDGRVAHRNHYTTRQIDRPNWPTHARYRIEANSPVGVWTVRLKYGARVLHSNTFKVHSGGKPAKDAP
jgi:hypothetical protein